MSRKHQGFGSITLATVVWMSACGTSQSESTGRSGTNDGGGAGGSRARDGDAGGSAATDSGSGVTGIGAPCKTTLDCSGRSVCDGSAGVCVECTADADCGAGKACALNGCVTSIPCSSDLECKDRHQLCDPSRSRCVDCFTDSTCSSGAHCLGGACSPVICSPGAQGCFQNATFTCSSDGVRRLSLSSCGDGGACVEHAGAAVCVAPQPPAPDPNGPLTIVAHGWVAFSAADLVDVTGVLPADPAEACRSANFVGCPTGSACLADPLSSHLVFEVRWRGNTPLAAGSFDGTSLWEFIVRFPNPGLPTSATGLTWYSPVDGAVAGAFTLDATVVDLMQTGRFQATAAIHKMSGSISLQDADVTLQIAGVCPGP